MEIDQITSLVSIFSFGQQIMAAAAASAAASTSTSTAATASVCAAAAPATAAACPSPAAESPAAAAFAAAGASSTAALGVASPLTPDIQSGSSSTKPAISTSEEEEDSLPDVKKRKGVEEDSDSESDTSSDSGHSSDDLDNDKSEENPEEEVSVPALTQLGPEALCSTAAAASVPSPVDEGPLCIKVSSA
jgi:hypothetical protein